MELPKKVKNKKPELKIGLATFNDKMTKKKLK